MKAQWIRLVFTAGLLLLATQARADCVGYDTGSWSASAEAQARQCLTKLNLAFNVEKCDLAICRRVVEWRKKPTKERASDAPALLERITANLQPSVGQLSEAAELTARMSAFVEQLKAATPEVLADPVLDPFRNAQSRRWSYSTVAGSLVEEGPASPGEQPTGIHLGRVLARSCNVPLDQPNCDAAVRATGAMVLHTLLYQSMVTWFVQDDREAFARHVENTRARWAAYFDNSRVQFPWELALNSWRFQRELKDRRDRGQPEGFGLSSPPNDQWIFLHPSVGLRYGGAPDRRFDQAVFLELAGYYRWEWSGTSVKNLLGGSLIATWANGGTEQRKGYGLMVHLPKNYSVGLIQEHGGGQRKLGLVVSIDLGKLIQDQGAAKRKLLAP